MTAVALSVDRTLNLTRLVKVAARSGKLVVKRDQERRKGNEGRKGFAGKEMGENGTDPPGRVRPLNYTARDGFVIAGRRLG